MSARRSRGAYLAVGKAPVLVIGASPVAEVLFRMIFGIGSGKLGEATRSVTLRFMRTCRRTHKRVNNV